MTTGRRRGFLVLGGLLLAIAGGCAVLTATVTTSQGLNFEVSTHRLPLYLKALQFIDRSMQYQQIADEIAGNAVSDTDRVLKVFEWTQRQIKNTPDGWPIVDDHILHIIIRGHGLNDQKADVFATLASYAGVPAFWSFMRVESPRARTILSFARIDGRWRVFDIENAVVFRTDDGELATLDDLRGHPERVPASARSIVIDGVPYEEIVTTASMPPIPNPLRVELQMPSLRLWHELKRVLRIESDGESGR
jgi:hypothetical protein